MCISSQEGVISGKDVKLINYDTQCSLRRNTFLLETWRLFVWIVFLQERLLSSLEKETFFKKKKKKKKRVHLAFAKVG